VNDRQDWISSKTLPQNKQGVGSRLAISLDWKKHGQENHFSI
jgi:hypothetical protein